MSFLEGSFTWWPKDASFLTSLLLTISSPSCVFLPSIPTDPTAVWKLSPCRPSYHYHVHHFQVLVQNIYMAVVLTVASSKGNANGFDAESRTSFPVIEISLLIAAGERDKEKETPHLASVPVKIHKRVPHPHILHPYPTSSPGDLVLLTILLSPAPLPLILSPSLNHLALQASRAPLLEESPLW